MGLLEVVTIVFIILKLIGVISWSWWLVCLPLLIALGIYLIILSAFVLSLFGIKHRFSKKN